MTCIRAFRFAALAALAIGLSACGFHLRNHIALPPDLGPVKVVSSSQYSPLAEAVARGLQGAGATLAEGDAKDVATLRIRSERWGDRPIAIDASGRAQEYSLRYAAVFELTRADGSELVPQQVVELSRDYVTPPVDVVGTDTEREVLAEELGREMSASILRRVDSVIKRGIRNAPTPADSAPVEPPQDEGTDPAAPAPAAAETPVP